MKNRKLLRRGGLFLLCLLLLLPIMPTVSANSAQTWFDGQDSTGAFMPAGSESPIVVEGERLIFDIPHFPVLHGNAEDNAAYEASVTAEYTFYNPSDYTVTSHLLFPFGQKPYYMDGAFDPETGEHVPFDDTAAYAITLDGEAVEKRVRHTLNVGRSFDLEVALAYFSDDFYRDGFFSPEMTVTKYTYRTSDVNKEDYPAASVAFQIPSGGFGEERRVWFPQMHIYQTHFRKSYVGTWVDFSPENEITLYVLGEPLAEPIEWSFYKNGGLDLFEGIEGSISLLRTESMTLRELALADWYAESGVSEVDWYNAVIASFDEGKVESSGLLGRSSYAPGNDLTGNLMRWYEYEITFAPGQRRINTVTAPIYPAVDMGWEPDVYEYTYLLSPAATWVDFGRIEIFINTPYYIVNDEYNAFAPRTEQGYQKMLPGLPEGELTFSLSTVEDPEEVDNGGFWWGLLLILVLVASGIGYLLLACIGIGIWNILRGGIALLVIVILKKREKKNKEE